MTFFNGVNLINSNIPQARQYGLGFKGTSSLPNLEKGNAFVDSYTSNPINTDFGNSFEIESAAKSNPRITALLKKNGIPLKLNFDELKSLQKGHLQNSRVIAAKIYSALPSELKKEINLSDLQEAAMLHDYGKVLIPKEVLNKENSLNQSEKNIMELHSELGYELLKSKGVKPSVLNLVKYHHQKPDGTGYPAAGSDFEYTKALEILYAADKYSALTEKRSYKPALSKEEALDIMRQDVDSGLISQEVYEALLKQA